MSELDDALVVVSKAIGLRLRVSKEWLFDPTEDGKVYLGGRIGESFKDGSSFFIAIKDGQIVKYEVTRQGKVYGQETQ
jgi:hypothetical protein